ncbi:MAG: SGNH/GDSL hydrolase family protein [Patescibacteria group bacterium]
MKISLKFALTAFFVGIILGLGISPWTDTKPQKVITSPLSLTHAKTLAQKNTPLQKPKHTSLSMKQYFTLFDQEQERKSSPQILGDKTAKPPVSQKKGSVTIALVGDSMVDTMGTDLPYLNKALKEYYPNMQFNLLNYGIGAETVIKAAERINSAYTYKDRSYPKITEANPQVVIVESFAYNPLEENQGGKANYRHHLQSVIQKLHESRAKVVFLATISPVKQNFGKGPGGVNWDTSTAWNHATKIQSYLEEGLKVAREMNLPTIDCYHPTLLSTGEGIAKYVSSHDGIHPSEAGHTYVANEIAQALGRLQIF